MKIIGLGLVAALALAACSMQSKTVEQSTTPSAGPAQAALTYPAHNMAEFDSAMQEADDHCYKQEDLRRAHYVDRDFERAHFECAYR